MDQVITHRVGTPHPNTITVCLACEAAHGVPGAYYMGVSHGAHRGCCEHPRHGQSSRVALLKVMVFFFALMTLMAGETSAQWRSGVLEGYDGKPMSSRYAVSDRVHGTGSGTVDAALGFICPADKDPNLLIRFSAPGRTGNHVVFQFDDGARVKYATMESDSLPGARFVSMGPGNEFVSSRIVKVGVPWGNKGYAEFEWRLTGARTAIKHCVSAKRSETLFENHSVRPGESLWQIARDYGTTIDRLKSANDLVFSRVYPGQALKIPNSGYDHARRTGDAYMAIGDHIWNIQEGTPIGVDWRSRVATWVAIIDKPVPPEAFISALREARESGNRDLVEAVKVLSGWYVTSK